ncbi:cytochrome c-type biogenesis protein CcmH [Chloroflexota bacterium]
MKRIFLAIALSLVLLPVTPVMADSPTVGDISKQLICPCDCTEVLSTCDCATQEELVASIEQKLAEGQSEEQIIQSFVDQYGKQVLASTPQQVPASAPEQGLNLMVWGLPFAGLLFGGGIVYIALTKRSKQSQHPQTRQQPKTREK